MPYKIRENAEPYDGLTFFEQLLYLIKKLIFLIDQLIIWENHVVENAKISQVKLSIILVLYARKRNKRTSVNWSRRKEQDVSANWVRFPG